MPKRNRKSDFALIALAISVLVSAIFAAILLEVIADSPSYQPLNTNTQHEQSSNHARVSDNQSYNWDKPVWGPWYGLWFERSDTIAQWLMMAFTIAATVVLAFTLRSANKTNAAAVKASNAALEANEIMRHEQRPWITTVREVDCEFLDRDGISGELTWNYNFANKGKTPAYRVMTRIKLFKDTSQMECLAEMEAFTEQCVSQRHWGSTDIIFPGDVTEFLPRIRCSLNYHGEVNEAGRIEKVQRTGDKFSALVCVTYKTGLSDKSPIGVETSAYGIDERKGFIGPWRFKMLEYSGYRIVR